MPRITLLRIVLLPILAYITLIVLWIALPSPPSVHGGNYGHYHQDVLRSGRWLTSEYTDEKYRPSDGVAYLHADCFSVDWQLFSNVAHKSIGLRIGENATINLTDLANIAIVDTPYTDLTISGVVPAIAKQGVLDGVMLPWFDEADQCLLNWEIEHVDLSIDFRAIVVETGVIQIWPESTQWHTEPLQMPPYDSSFKPFFTISNIPVSGDTTNIKQVEISDMTWRIPSRTYPIRLALIKMLKPITLSASGFIEGYIAPALDYLGVGLVWLLHFALYFLVLAVIALACWSASSQPPHRLPFLEWLRQRFWLTKWLYAKPVEDRLRGVWMTRWLYPKSRLRVIKGPGGVIAHIDDDKEEDGNDYQRSDADDDFVQVLEMRTLRSPLDFFRSRAPLDDLLNTFTYTRWMTAPIGRPRRTCRNRFAPSDGIAIAIERKADTESNV